MLNVATAIRNAQSHGGLRVVDLPKAWKLGRRRSRLRRRLFLVVGLLMGIFVVATLLWGILERDDR